MLIEPEPSQKDVDAIVSRGPAGAFALAGAAAAIVVLIWIAFYLLVYLPRA
ncbi:MAG: hypothetical protein ACM3Y9_05475 [Ignavibacteria bacterium]